MFSCQNHDCFLRPCWLFLFSLSLLICCVNSRATGRRKKAWRATNEDLPCLFLKSKSTVNKQTKQNFFLFRVSTFSWMNSLPLSLTPFSTLTPLCPLCSPPFKCWHVSQRMLLHWKGFVAYVMLNPTMPCTTKINCNLKDVIHDCKVKCHFRTCICNVPCW